MGKYKPLMGKIARIVAVILLLISASLLVFLSSTSLLLRQPKTPAHALYLSMEIIFGIIFSYGIYSLVKNKRKFFPTLILLISADFLLTTIYRLSFITNGGLNKADFGNFWLFIIPVGLVYISYCFEQETRPYPASESLKKIEAEPFSPLQYQSFVPRGLAQLIDQAIIVIPLFIMALLAKEAEITAQTNLSKSFPEKYYLTGAIVFLIYMIIAEAKWGQTLGKKLLKIKVVMANGQPCTLKGAILRNVGRIFDLILGYLLGIIVIVLTKKRQRIGDLIAQTVVVKFQ